MANRDDRDQLLDRFESAWQEGPTPAIEEFLPPAGASRQPAADPRRQDLLHELVKIDLEYRWRRPDQGAAGPRPSRSSLPALPRLEDYVERFTEMGPLASLPIELIAEEYRVRQRWGDRPDHAEYVSRFPRQGTQLGSVLCQIDAELDGEPATAKLRDSPSSRGIDRPPPPRKAVRLRCPHCRHSIEIPAELLLRDLACSACGGTFSVESLSMLPGRSGESPFSRLGRYELGELLGTGAFGSVWRARDTELARDVAVKLPRSGQFLGPAQEERFLREARFAARLHHPGIVAVHDVGRDQETLYIVSELVHGVSLAEWLRRRRLSFHEAAELVACVADALDFAHQRGVVHRDVKPSNIMLKGERRGARGERAPDSSASCPAPLVPMITDFGLALRDASEVTMTLDGQVLGTPAYISPEQLRDPHAVDGRSDVYSLGVILYELLTGELPFRGMTRMLLEQVLSDEPRPPRRLNDRIPRGLETICLKCLAKDSASRYRTAAALAADLRRWLRGQPILARPVARVQRLWLWVRRNPALAVTGSVVVGGLVAMTGMPAAVVLLALVAVTVGSLLFALHKTKTAGELVHALDDARQDQLKTASALHFALRKCLRARKERDRALAAESQSNRRFGLARGLAKALIFDFPDKIEGPASPAPARSFLVQTASAYLGSLAQEVRDEPLLLRELAVAYARLGDVQANAIPASQGDIAGALTSYRQSLELFAVLARNHPNNAQAQRDVALGHDKVRELERAIAQATLAPASSDKR